MIPGTFASPAGECDVVLRGVPDAFALPAGTFELARTHRLRSVRGTSAGALAAVFTAAAEFGRERGGFEKLASLEAWLADDAHVASLFSPTPEARPLHTLLVSLEHRGRRPVPGPGIAGMVARFWAMFPEGVRVVFDVLPGAARDALPMRYWTGTVLGGIVGGALDGILARGLVDASHPVARTVVAILLPVMFVGCWFASAGACAARLWRIATVQLPRQGFGLCTGAGAAPGAGPPAFTAWLHERIQDLAGLPANAPPLTVGALAGKRLNGQDAGIELSLAVTPAGAPEALISNTTLAFAEDEMRGLFAPPIVDHLLATARPAEPGLHRLPARDDLPVVLLARMGVSLPVMLSAVPLHAPSAGGQRRVWFGDTGTRRNIVLRLADAWLPARRTGIEPDPARSWPHTDPNLEWTAR